MIPTIEQNPKGLHKRYKIEKVDGTQINDGAEYFVLRVDENGTDIAHLQASRRAIQVYATEIARHLPQLAEDIRSRYPISPYLIVAQHFIDAGFEDTGDAVHPWAYYFGSNQKGSEFARPALLFGYSRNVWEFSVVLGTGNAIYLNCHTIDEAKEFIGKIVAIDPGY